MNDELFQKLLVLTRDTSLSRLKIHARRDDIEIEPRSDDPLVMGHWMSLILVSGKDVRVTFKVHFMTTAAKYLATNVYQRNAEEISLEQSADFFKEFCNLSAGHIKRVLEENELTAGISLPVLTRGFDEVFFSRKSPYPMVRSQWRLKCGTELVDCSAHIEIFNDFKLHHVESSGEQEDMGDVEFF